MGDAVAHLSRSDHADFLNHHNFLWPGRMASTGPLAIYFIKIGKRVNVLPAAF